ncbi:MAG TPA: hypothetical protein VJL59_12935 [Anaerolineales bacterium]|nr:hypothetical protein [Anaerolineales bacterium]
MFKRKTLLVGLAFLLLVGLAGVSVALAQAEGGGVTPPYTVAQALTEEEIAAGKQGQVQYFDSFEAAMQSIGAAPADFKPADSDRSAPERHCVILIEPLQPGQQASVASEPVCFARFPDAIYAATGDTVRLAPAVRPADVTQDMLAPASTTVISIDYANSNFQGSTLVWVANNSVGCNTGYSYSAPTMPSGWNDVVSSAQTYGGCNNNPHYEHTNYGGAVLTCTCSTMGVMDNATSSEKWSQ